MFFYKEPAQRDAVPAAYLDEMISFVGWLLGRGLRVILLTGAKMDESIAEVIRESVSGHWSEELIEVARSETLQDLMQHMRRVDQVVGSRYHNIIAAAMIAKPALAISYGPKHGELMNDLGLGRFVQQIEKIDGEYLREQFLDLQRSSGEVARLMAAKSREYRHLVDQQWSVIESTILSA
jgi:polysaccharide pyruvyl transferase WcaK-like protein